MVSGTFTPFELANHYCQSLGEGVMLGEIEPAYPLIGVVTAETAPWAYQIAVAVYGAAFRDGKPEWFAYELDYGHTIEGVEEEFRALNPEGFTALLTYAGTGFEEPEFVGEDYAAWGRSVGIPVDPGPMSDAFMEALGETLLGD